jgi:hypothetical protein
MAQTRVTDDSIKVRQLTGYQLSFIAGEAQKSGMWTLQLILDEGAWEEVISLTADDVDPLQEILARTDTVFYDIERRLFMFGVRTPGS